MADVKRDFMTKKQLLEYEKAIDERFKASAKSVSDMEDLF